MMKSSLEIQILICGGCANTIRTRLSEVEGVDNIVVDNDTDTVDFDYNTKEELENAVNLLSKLGYPVVGEANPLSKKAKSYVSCAIGRMQS